MKMQFNNPPTLEISNVDQIIQTLQGISFFYTVSGKLAVLAEVCAALYESYKRNFGENL